MTWKSFSVALLLAAAIAGITANTPVAAQQQAPSPDDPRLKEAAALYEQGRAATKARDFKKAIPLYEQVLALHEKALGLEHPRVATSSYNLAVLYWVTGEHAKAVPLHQRSLAIRERVLGPDHQVVATSLTSLAQLYEDRGEYAKALPLYQRALAIQEKVFGPEDDIEVLLTLNSLALLYQNMGDYTKALPFYSRTLEIREKALGPDHPDVTSTRNNLAVQYDNLAEYGKALSLYQKNLSILETALGQEHPNVATSLNNIALLFVEMGEYSKALPLYERSLSIREKAFGPEHPEVAISLSNLAHAYLKMGEYEQMRTFALRSLTVREKILGLEHPGVGVSLIFLANYYEAKNEQKKAIPIYQRSLAIFEKALGSGHPHVAMCSYYLAGAYQVTGESEKALSLANRALHIAIDRNVPETMWRAQAQLSTLITRNGKPELAIFYGKQAVNTIQGMRARLTDVDRELQHSFLRNKESVYRALADLLIAQGRLAEAQQVLGMLKEEEFFEFIRRSESDDPRQRRIAFQPHEQSWQLRFQAMQGKAVTEAEFNRYFSEIQTAFAVRAVTQVTESADAVANRAALQKTLGALGAGSVMLHFVQSEERLNIIVTTATSQTAKQIPLKVSDLNQQIDRLRRVLRSPQSKPLPAAQELHQTLIAPIAADLDKTGAKTLMFYLDGALRYIPMAALHDGKQFLAERYALAIYTEVASNNLTLIPAGNRTIAGLGLTRAIEDHDALPAVKAELESIVKTGGNGLIPGEMYLDEQFSARQLQASLSRPLVHVASHFVFRPGTEATSYLLLGDGDRLTLKRMRDDKYDFGRVDLLTLSACETGLGGGRDAGGQEVEGLGVLVQRQGAKGVIATLWPVADASTALFMQHMYRLREQNLTKAEALRQAQIVLIRGQAAAGGSDAQRGAARTDAQTPATSAGYSHPYFWAPFILMGNWL